MALSKLVPTTIEQLYRRQAARRPGAARARQARRGDLRARSIAAACWAKRTANTAARRRCSARLPTAGVRTGPATQLKRPRSRSPRRSAGPPDRLDGDTPRWSTSRVMILPVRLLVARVVRLCLMAWRTTRALCRRHVFSRGAAELGDLRPAILGVGCNGASCGRRGDARRCCWRSPFAPIAIGRWAWRPCSCWKSIGHLIKLTDPTMLPRGLLDQRGGLGLSDVDPAVAWHRPAPQSGQAAGARAVLEQLLAPAGLADRGHRYRP